MSVFFTRRGKAADYTPVPLDNFAANDWATIIWACQTGNVPDTWTVGSQKSMTINGKDYPIDIIGLGHDDYADGSGKAPITFQMHDCYNKSYVINSTATTTGGWKSCDMRTRYLPIILAFMPTEVQGGIREVRKASGVGDYTNTTETTADKLFLLSEVEIFNSNGNSTSGEGSHYAYYTNRESRGKNSRWWTRSARGSYWNYVFQDGTIGLGDPDDTGLYPAPAFCF